MEINEIQLEAIKERGRRELEIRYSKERDNLLSFIQTYWKEELKQDFVLNWHYKVIEYQLERVLKGECKRLIINVPPRTYKTGMISQCFPAWILGKDPTKKFIITSYSTELAQKISMETRNIYLSQTYRKIFPKKEAINDDQNTKSLWINSKGGQYYATGAGGSITGTGSDIFIIDDPIKPEDANSKIIRDGINSWYYNTVVSRLNNMSKGVIIIIMQRIHEDDLCGRLIQDMESGKGAKWDIIKLPAIAEVREEWQTKDGFIIREEGQELDPIRLPKRELLTINADTFSTQFQQNPRGKESQEFHQEWIYYYDQIPPNLRVFTAVDPAFSQKQSADESAIITCGFLGEKLYILELTYGKFDPGELTEKMVYHIRKWNPEKIGIEAFQAQVTLGFSLRLELQKKGLHVLVEDIRQTGDKESKIRRLIYLYRNGLIYHHRDLRYLEEQLYSFPRGRRDDCIDALQMVYNMYTMQPNAVKRVEKILIDYDMYGRPIGLKSNQFASYE